jgi:hypothetical protein
MRQVEILVHNDPTVVAKDLWNSVCHLSQPCTNHCPADNRTLLITITVRVSAAPYGFSDYLLLGVKKKKKDRVNRAYGTFHVRWPIER